MTDRYAILNHIREILKVEPSMSDNLLDRVRDALADFDNQHAQLTRDLDEVREKLNQVALVNIVLEADLPEGSLVEIVEWSDEANPDNTFDMTLGQVYSADGDELEDLTGAVDTLTAGRDIYSDGTISTDWDVFLGGNGRQISVDKVREWVQREAWKTPRKG